MSLLKELFAYMKERKKYWLIPIFTIMFLFGWLIIMTEGSVVAPFIYTLF